MPCGGRENEMADEITYTPADFLSSVSVIARNDAEWAYERLANYIKRFEDGLDADHEVGLRLVSHGDSTFHVVDAGYWGPDIITFHGVNGKGQTVQLIQHLSQLNVLLVAVQKLGSEAKRIGFTLVERVSDEKK